MMELKVNGEAIDVTLEHEKSAFDVIYALIHQFEDKNMLVSSVEIDGKFYPFDDPALKDLQIDSIEHMNVEVSDKESLIISLLVETKNILTKIAYDMKTNGFSHVKEFNELLTWVSETVKTINQLALFNMVESKLLISTIHQIVEYINSNQKDEKKIDSLAGIISSLIRYIEAMELKITSNFSVTKEEMVEAIQNGVAILPEIAESFQVGKDKDALDKIHSIISVLELCCIYLKKNIAHFSAEVKDEIDSLYEEINTLLTQVVEAFENGDLVLLGDLLEYELPEKFETYKRLILE